MSAPVWKDAPGFPGVEVSSFGHVRGPGGMIVQQKLGDQWVVTINGKHVAVDHLVRTAFPPKAKSAKRSTR